MFKENADCSGLWTGNRELSAVNREHKKLKS